MISILNYILFGILIYVVLIPIGEEIVSVIVQLLEVAKGWMLVSVAKAQAKVHKIGAEIKKSNIHAIGFDTSSINNEEDYDDDDDE